MSETEGLYGSDDHIQTAAADYESPEGYEDQGDTRTVRDLEFTYKVETTDANGNTTLTGRTVPRGTEVTVDQIGKIALQEGETNHSFYTSEELDRLEASGTEAEPVTADTNISELGEVELAEWIKTGNDGGAFNVNQVLEAVGNDAELAHRMLAAENIASDGDPRKGLEDGLTRVIETE